MEFIINNYYINHTKTHQYKIRAHTKIYHYKIKILIIIYLKIKNMMCHKILKNKRLLLNKKYDISFQCLKKTIFFPKKNKITE